MKEKIIVICVVLVIGMLGMTNCASSVVFPYTIVLPHYNISWRDASSATAEISIVLPNATQPSLLLSLNTVTNWIEYQAPADIFVYTKGDEFADKIAHETIEIQNISTTSSPFNVVEILAPNSQGLSYTSTLSNGANVLINFTINQEADLTLPIPRQPGDQNCSMDNRFEANCTCQQNHVVPKHSFKFTVQVTNWTFAPLRPNMTFSILGQKTFLLGDFNLDYYLLVPDSSQLLHFDVCDVANSPLNMSRGAVITKMSLFANFFSDGVPNQVSSVLGKPGIDQATGLATFPFTFLYPAFQRELLYDPDFSVLLTGGNGQGGGEGATGGNGDGGSNKNVTIAVAVVIPIVAVVVFIIVVVGIISAFLITKKRKETFAKAAEGSV
eukprot:TRINITY_DN846_c0_g1_i2.p1 TRINITY_DN846_c0_g1~~TRINITY_DN846_c0_g1_i2.p1  ORF type:complete len:400 (+),score=97.88 TRINITY_DN846_c0_g1_i2:52-1200(+)